MSDQPAIATPTIRSGSPWALVAVVGLPLIGLALVVGCLTGLWFATPSRDSSRPFESQLWKEDFHPTHPGSDGHPTRDAMVGSLLSQKLLAGKRRAEIESILGPPDIGADESTRMHVGQLLGLSSESILYDLTGPRPEPSARGSMPMRRWLYVVFDNANIALDAGLIQARFY